MKGIIPEHRFLVRLERKDGSIYRLQNTWTREEAEAWKSYYREIEFTDKDEQITIEEVKR